MKFSFSQATHTFSSLCSICAFLCLFAFCNNAQAQAVPDTFNTNLQPDTIIARKVGFDSSLANEQTRNLATAIPLADTVIKKGLWQPNPKKSGLLSLMLPGTGQLYNRQYWKLPIVYGGAAAAAYFLIENNKNYQLYRRAYIARIDTDPTNDAEYQSIYDIYQNPDQLKQLRDGFRGYQDLTILFSALGYMLQVADAVIFAHLKNFDVSPDISLKMMPVIAPGFAGMGLVLKW